MSAIRAVTVVYDAGCGLCSALKEWIDRQDTFVGMEFVPAGSDEASRRFPGLSPDELAVVANTGEVWLGNHAWIVCLWALRDYRELAFRLTGPLLSMMAREAFAMVSSNRFAISRLLEIRGDRELELHLKRVAAPACEVRARPKGF